MAGVARITLRIITDSPMTRYDTGWINTEQGSAQRHINHVNDRRHSRERGRRNVKLTDDNLYITYILENRTQVELMQIFGLTRRQLQLRLKEAELQKKTEIPHDIERMHQKGLTYEELADYYDTQVSQVRSWLRRTGLRRMAYKERRGQREAVR